MLGVWQQCKLNEYKHNPAGNHTSSISNSLFMIIILKHQPSLHNPVVRVSRNVCGLDRPTPLPTTQMLMLGRRRRRWSNIEPELASLSCWLFCVKVFM